MNVKNISILSVLLLVMLFSVVGVYGFIDLNSNPALASNLPTLNLPGEHCTTILGCQRGYFCVNNFCTNAFTNCIADSDCTRPNSVCSCQNLLDEYTYTGPTLNPTTNRRTPATATCISHDSIPTTSRPICVAKGANGERCSRNVECMSDNCVSSVCTRGSPKANGASCSTNADCQSNNCGTNPDSSAVNKVICLAATAGSTTPPANPPADGSKSCLYISKSSGHASFTNDFETSDSESLCTNIGLGDFNISVSGGHVAFVKDTFDNSIPFDKKFNCTAVSKAGFDIAVYLSSQGGHISLDPNTFAGPINFNCSGTLTGGAAGVVKKKFREVCNADNDCDTGLKCVKLDGGNKCAYDAVGNSCFDIKNAGVPCANITFTSGDKTYNYFAFCGVNHTANINDTYCGGFGAFANLTLLTATNALQCMNKNSSAFTAQMISGPMIITPTISIPANTINALNSSGYGYCLMPPRQDQPCNAGTKCADGQACPLSGTCSDSPNGGSCNLDSQCTNGHCNLTIYECFTPSSTCASDIQCSGSTSHCSSGQCVQCISGATCPSGQKCTNNVCVASAPPTTCSGTGVSTCNASNNEVCVSAKCMQKCEENTDCKGMRSAPGSSLSGGFPFAYCNITATATNSLCTQLPPIPCPPSGCPEGSYCGRFGAEQHNQCLADEYGNLCIGSGCSPNQNCQICNSAGTSCAIVATRPATGSSYCCVGNTTLPKTGCVAKASTFVPSLGGEFYIVKGKCENGQKEVKYCKDKTCSEVENTETEPCEAATKKGTAADVPAFYTTAGVIALLVIIGFYLLLHKKNIKKKGKKR